MSRLKIFFPDIAWSTRTRNWASSCRAPRSSPVRSHLRHRRPDWTGQEETFTSQQSSKIRLGRFPRERPTL